MMVDWRTYPMAAIGVGLLLAGVLGLVVLRARPGVVRSTGLVYHALTECRANLNLARGGKIIAVGETRAIPFKIIPRQEARTKPCEYQISISTKCPVGTESDQKRTVTLERDDRRATGELFLQCHQAGPQLVTVVSNLAGQESSQSMIYDVRHLGWFTAPQMVILSWIASFLGPALALPLWLAVYRKWKAKRESEAAQSEAGQA
jgi:hypothetical protein